MSAEEKYWQDMEDVEMDDVTPTVGRIYAEPMSGVNESKYFYDGVNNAYRNRRDDRKTISQKLWNSNTSEETADYIIDNLNRYQKSGKSLSGDGYDALRESWDIVKNRTSKKNSSEFLTAETYMLAQANTLGKKSIGFEYATETRSQRLMDSYIERESSQPLPKEGIFSKAKGLASKLRLKFMPKWRTA